MTSEYTLDEDIVTRLRNYGWMRDGEYPLILMKDAADEIERLGTALNEAEDTIHGCELVIDNQKAIIDRNAWGDSRTSDGGLDGADTADYGPFTPQLVEPYE